MAEVIRTTDPTPDSINPTIIRPNHAAIPHELINPLPNASEKRGRFIEERVRAIIASRVDLVESVIANEPNGKEDALGHDLTVILKDNSPLRIVYVQVKSRKEAITAYKQKIRDKYFFGQTNSPELVKQWLTEHGIILINGSQTKTDLDILNDSFTPQLERIQKDTLRRQNTESSGQMRLFTRYNQIQIFPEAI